ncbi:hypothetical protein GN157_12540 [Flavobacterium rakeshii]|uniref:Ig-like domain-containing protein n=1 Tax=Flavobacterium rakeshii TaxID=1038845 RepID=A0A6N8HFQ7_9FLAO|nr:SprB repeat-containing protein [Flavobacterium rakeshii]MUV04538.1 hypothetical protein [Flavobacterium rakeshii]
MSQKFFLRLTLLLLIASCTGIFMGCSDDDSHDAGQTGTQSYELTVFKNQTGNPDASALQAQYKDDKGTLNVYGGFDGNNAPADIHTLTYQINNNDTIVNMVIDPVFNRIKSTFFTVNGTKQPMVMNFNYAHENVVNVSFYDYDWVTQSAALLYSSNVLENSGNYTSNPVYSGRNVSGTNSWEALGVIGSSILISEGIILAVGGETVVLAALGTAAAPIIATVGTVGVAVGIAAVALAVITADANASELEPSDIPYPPDTPIENPVTLESDPTENLVVSECIENTLTYNVFMDWEGTIVVETPSDGGIPPFSYFLEGQSGFTDTGIYAGDYENGDYLVAVKDGNGCITAKMVTLNRDCSGSDLAVTAFADEDTATASVSGGQPPYAYQWSDGSTTSSVTGLADGEYTITITDANGCTASASVAIEITSTILAGTWNMNITLGGGECDETLLMDETGAILQFVFNDNQTVTFLNDPSGMDLNSGYYSQVYQWVPEEQYLEISIQYSDFENDESIHFEIHANYDEGTHAFTGTYTNIWSDGVMCQNTVQLYQ